MASLVVVVAMLAAMCGSSGSPAAADGREPGPAAPATKPTPLIEFSPPVMDFGLVEQGKAVEGTVTVRNLSDHPVRIVAAKSGCGCTAPKLSKNRVEAGESTPVVVRFSPRGSPGEKSSRVINFLLEGQDQPVPYEVSGEVVRSIVAEPSSIKADSAEGVKVVIRSTDNVPFSMVSCRPEGAVGDLPHAPASRHEFTISPETLVQCQAATTIEIDIDHPRVKTIRLPLRTAEDRGLNASRPRRESHRSETRTAPAAPEETSLQVLPRRLRLLPGPSQTKDLLLVGAVLSETEPPVLEVSADGAMAEAVAVKQGKDGLIVSVKLTANPITPAEQRGKLRCQVGLSVGTVELSLPVSRSSEVRP